MIYPQRYLVTIIKSDDSVFTYGCKTIGGRANAIDRVRSFKKSNSINEEYFIHARISDEKADYELPDETSIKIPDWVNTF